MKRVVTLFIAIILAFGILSCQTNNNERDILIVGLEAAYAPFNWSVQEASAHDEAYPLADSNLYVDGYDVQIARQIADELDMELVIKAIEWDGLIPSLVSTEEIDLIIAGMSPTSERAQTVNFTDEYYISTHVVLLAEDSKFSDARSINDFQGASVVAQISTIYDEIIDQMTGAIHADALPDVPTIITAINQGTYDATIVELPVAIAITQTNPNLTYIEFDEADGFNVSYEDRAVSIALRQEDTSLLEQINQILSEISEQAREDLMLDAIERQPS